MDVEHKAFGATIDTQPEGIVEAIVSVFSNTDNVGERVMPGAFTKSISGRLPKLVWQHDWSSPIGKTLEAKELPAGDPRLPAALSDFGGLYVKGQLNMKTQRGKEAFEDLAFGAMDEFSIGYRVVRDSIEEKSGVRELHELLLYEWSPVLVGANPATQLLTVKAGVPTTLAVEAEAALMSMLKLYERMKSLADLRKSQDREPLTATNKARIAACSEAIAKLQKVGLDLESLLVEPEAKADLGEVRQVYASYLLTVSANYRSQ